MADAWKVWRRDRDARDPDEWTEVDSGTRAYCERAADDRNTIAQRLDPSVEFTATGPMGGPT